MANNFSNRVQFWYFFRYKEDRLINGIERIIYFISIDIFNFGNFELNDDFWSAVIFFPQEKRISIKEI